MRDGTVVVDVEVATCELGKEENCEQYLSDHKIFMQTF